MNKTEDDEILGEPIYVLKWVDGKKIMLLGHDMQSMEFEYWGAVRSLEGDPHGVGVAFCTANRMHCYMGTWEKGQLKGLG